MKRHVFASILFADIVKFSDRAIDDERRRAISIRLQEIVRGCVLLQGKERGTDYLNIYTGDGFALVFLGNALDAFLAGLELNRKLETDDIPCRLGLHCGDVSLITDINDQVNSVGSTVNDASRVMSFGGRGHLLASKIYRDLIIRHKAEYKDCFHAIGNYQDKNGEVHVLYNVYTDDAGNRDIPHKGRISEKKSPDPQRRRFPPLLGQAPENPRPCRYYP